MRKQRVFKAFIAMALAFAIAAGVFVTPHDTVQAADLYNMIDLFYKATVKSKDLKSAKANMVLYVNGNKLNKKAFTVYGEIKGKKESIIYLPSKAVTEAAGGNYKQSGKKVTITFGDVQLKYTRGKNSYVFTVPNEDGGKDKITYNYGMSCKKSSQVYIPTDIFIRFTEYVGVDFSCNLEGKKFYIDFSKGIDVVDGGWADRESLVVPDILVKYFKNANKANPDDDQIVPVACLREQVVAGVNYELLCRISNPSKGEEEVYALVEMYVDIDGHVHDGSFIKTDAKTNLGTGMMGAWSQPDDISFPAEYRDAFNKATENLPGVEYKPLALLATQVVNGINVCILCSSSIVAPGGNAMYVLIYANVNPLTQNAELIDIKALEEAKENNNSGEAVVNVDYMPLSGPVYAALTPEGLSYIVNEDQSTWDNLALINNDMVIDREISTMGNIGIQSGATVTVEENATLAGHITIEEGATVIVKKGGLLTTAQGDQEGVFNMGTIIVEEGGELLSRMGSTVVNAQGGTIELSGDLRVGCIKYEGNTGIWFKNEGKVTGKGKVIAYEIQIGDEVPDMDACVAELKKMIGKKSTLNFEIEKYEAQGNE